VFCFFFFLKIVIEKIGLSRCLKMNHFLVWLQIRLFSGLPGTQRSACDTALWLPALKRELEKQLLTSGEIGLVLAKLDLYHLFIRTFILC